MKTLIAGLIVAVSIPVLSAELPCDETETADVKGGEKIFYCAGEDRTPFIKKSKDGKKTAEGHLRKGRLHGPFKSYHPNGNLEKTGRYDNGEMRGEWRRYRADGVLRDSGSWRNGKPHGKWQFYGKNGERERTATYACGVDLSSGARPGYGYCSSSKLRKFRVGILNLSRRRDDPYYRGRDDFDSPMFSWVPQVGESKNGKYFRAHFGLSPISPPQGHSFLLAEVGASMVFETVGTYPWAFEVKIALERWKDAGLRPAYAFGAHVVNNWIFTKKIDRFYVLVGGIDLPREDARQIHIGVEL